MSKKKWITLIGEGRSLPPRDHPKSNTSNEVLLWDGIYYFVGKFHYDERAFSIKGISTWDNPVDKHNSFKLTHWRKIPTAPDLIIEDEE